MCPSNRVRSNVVAPCHELSATAKVAVVWPPIAGLSRNRFLNSGTIVQILRRKADSATVGALVTDDEFAVIRIADLCDTSAPNPLSPSLYPLQRTTALSDTILGYLQFQTTREGKAIDFQSVQQTAIINTRGRFIGTGQFFTMTFLAIKYWGRVGRLSDQAISPGVRDDFNVRIASFDGASTGGYTDYGDLAYSTDQARFAALRDLFRFELPQGDGIPTLLIGSRHTWGLKIDAFSPGAGGEFLEFNCIGDQMHSNYRSDHRVQGAGPLLAQAAAQLVDRVRTRVEPPSCHC